MNDVMVLNDIIEQAGRQSRASDHGGEFVWVALLFCYFKLKLCCDLSKNSKGKQDDPKLTEKTICFRKN